VPLTECLKDTVARVLPAWNDAIAPAIRAGKQIIISAHGNSLRALIKYLDGISDNDIVGLNIPNGQPLVYELDADLKPIKSYYLGDQSAIEAAPKAVANQGSRNKTALLQQDAGRTGGVPFRSAPPARPALRGAPRGFASSARWCPPAAVYGCRASPSPSAPGRSRPPRRNRPTCNSA
jgi:hypothetical protein